MITTYCYGERKDFKTAKDAILYFVEGINCCDPGSSECARYVSIVQQLRAGAKVATDGSVFVSSEEAGIRF